MAAASRVHAVVRSCAAMAAALIALALIALSPAYADSADLLDAPGQTFAEGTYIAYIAADDGKAAQEAIGIPDASTESGVQVRAFPLDDVWIQRLYMRLTPSGAFTIQPVNSGLYLTDSGGAVVQKGRMASTTQLWKASETERGVVLTNVGTGGNMVLAGTAVVTMQADEEDAQMFRMESTGLLTDGCYELSDVESGLLLDVEDRNPHDEANVQVSESAGKDSQAWLIVEEDDGFYTLTNNMSHIPLDAAVGAGWPGANVRQLSPNGSDSQLWKPMLRDDGTFAFENKMSGLMLAADGSDDGANVCQAMKRGVPCNWRLTQVESRSLTGDAKLDVYIYSIVFDHGKDLRACFDYLTNMKGVVEMVEGETLWGLMDEETTLRYATYVRERNESDCYGASAVFAYCARACGYDAYLRAGSVPAQAGAEVHGWTELYIDGETYVCDVSLGRALRDIDWYMVTYENAPVEYIY